MTTKCEFVLFMHMYLGFWICTYVFRRTKPQEACGYLGKEAQEERKVGTKGENSFWVGGNSLAGTEERSQQLWMLIAIFVCSRILFILLVTLFVRFKVQALCDASVLIDSVWSPFFRLFNHLRMFLPAGALLSFDQALGWGWEKGIVEAP